MGEAAHGPLRLWEGSREWPAVCAPVPGGPEEQAHRLAACELLRSPPRPRELPEPYSLQWFLELESRRYTRQGHWMPHLLEFAKHAGERILGLGSDMGSDWIQYARHGAEVIVCCPLAEQLGLVRRNFELRGLKAGFLHAEPAALPVEPASIDVVCLTGLLHAATSPERLIQEIFRVLKPGGKVLAVAPALRDPWSWWPFVARPGGGSGGPAALAGGPLSAHARRYGSRQLRQVFERFSEVRLYRRHLRRAEVPHPLRWLPLVVLERLGGRLLVLKALKPVTARTCEQAAA